YNNKPLDLTRPIRLSGLPNAAKLQLTQSSRSPSVVSVALQLPESLGGSRFSGKFRSSTSLWLILRAYESGNVPNADPSKPLPKNINITQRAVPEDIGAGAGRLCYEQPCLHMIGQDYTTFTDLQKTLAQRGLNDGSVLIRLSFKNSGRPLDEAMTEITEYFKAVETPAQGETAEAHGAHAGAIGSMFSQPNVEKEPTPEAVAGEQNPTSDPVSSTPVPGNASGRPQAPESMPELPPPADADSPMNSIPQPDSTPVSPPPEPSISVYRPPSSDTPFAARQAHNPADFEPTVDHARAHQAVLARAGRNTRLPSDAELSAQERARGERLADVKSLTVRVRFPDQMQADLVLPPSQTGAGLHAQVQSMLDSAGEPFALKYTGPKGQPVPVPRGQQSLVRELGFAGKVLVLMVWADGASAEAKRAPALREEFRVRAQELQIPVPAVGGSETAAQAGARAVAPEAGTAEKKRAGGDVEARMKKFLGLGKKK
ncbi:hypothetical protein LTR28_009435, partial [Elasticomyces elasticus]